MPNKDYFSDRVRGELLCEWRTSGQWELWVLAQSANLSVAQIRELESGGSSLFYTPAIKEAAARKVARLLGGDPDAVIDKHSDAPAPVLPSVVDDLVALTSKKPPFTSGWSAPWHHAVWLYLPAVLMLGFYASQWVHEKRQNGGDQQFWYLSGLQGETSQALVPLAAAGLPMPVSAPSVEALPPQQKQQAQKLIVKQTVQQPISAAATPSFSPSQTWGSLVSLPASYNSGR